MQCEMCGKETELINAIVEGTILNVCNKCAKFGNVIEIKKPVIREAVNKIGRGFPSKKEEEIERVVDDYSIKIKKSREKLGLKQKELAKQIAEKESVIHKIETGDLKPNLKLAKKLEQFLKIRLTEKYSEEKIVDLNLKDSNLTIGDLLRMKE